MSLFLIFGGNLALAQDGQITADNPKTPIFGSPITQTGGGGGECMLPNKYGQYCFSVPVNFYNLDFDEKGNAIFPNDLHIGFSIDGWNTNHFASLSKDVYYTFVEDYYMEGKLIWPAHYTAMINLGCFRQEQIEYLLTDHGCSEDSVITPGASGYQSLSISVDIYSNGVDGYEAIDFCKDSEVYEDILFGNNDSNDSATNSDVAFELEAEAEAHTENDVDCSLGANFSIRICCFDQPTDFVTNSDSPQNMTGDLVQVDATNSGIRVLSTQDKELTYSIFNMSGIKQLSGILDATESNILSNDNLENGIYILIITGEGYHSSHKFVSFR